MKKLFALLLTLAMVLSLAACGGKKEEAPAQSGGESEVIKEVNLWATGSDNVREIFETLTEKFNASQDTYEVKLNFMLSGTGTQTMVDMIVAAQKAGQTNTDYDLVDFSGDDWSKIIALVGEEAFHKIDASEIPNAASVEAKCAVSPEYSQPYRGTTVILAYNADKVDNVPTTYEELKTWIKEHPGRFAYNTPGTGGAGDSFVRTSVYNFIDDEAAMTSADAKWAEQWDEGFALLEELHPYMYQSGGSIVYPNKNQGTLDLLAQGEIDMCPNWADMVLSQRAAGSIPDSIKITTIQPSFTGSVQSLSIPTIGSNPEGAKAFIDYMLSEEAQSLLVTQMAAIPLVDTANMDMTGYEDLQTLDVSNFRILSIGDLSTTFNERWDNEIATLG
ncbi:MAG: extracellular solute-binding protein [Oscillibacter sp.]|nr:extracellular solute-binding protein [Oscillibacter sp.]